MTRWLVTGAKGMLGQEVMACLRARRETVMGLGRAELDVTDEAAVRTVITDYRPAVVVNCAAWTDVDAAEDDEHAALGVNGHGPEHVAVACAQTGARLLHVSTDYVFAGDATRPYAEDDKPAPSTSYGRTRLAGERAVLGLLPDAGLVVRTAWLYGASGPNFVHTMIRLAGTQPLAEAVDDRRGQPTWAADVARQLVQLGASQAPAGIYHATSSGETTWFGLAREIFLLLGADADRVRRTTSAAFPRPVPRPAYSVLGHARHAIAGLEPIGDWRLALYRCWPTLAVRQRIGTAS